MSTNYYTLSGKHIGKTAAAGNYCFNCDETLCKEGKEFVHSSSGLPMFNTGDVLKDLVLELEREHRLRWYDKCPKCNKAPDGETIGTCRSFNWTINRKELKNIRFVKDEYGEKFTIKWFNKLIDNCPIQFFDSIGKEFS